jgi:hypothetical protein
LCLDGFRLDFHQKRNTVIRQSPINPPYIFSWYSQRLLVRSFHINISYAFLVSLIDVVCVYTTVARHLPPLLHLAAAFLACTEKTKWVCGRPWRTSGYLLFWPTFEKIPCCLQAAGCVSVAEGRWHVSLLHGSAVYANTVPGKFSCGAASGCVNENSLWLLFLGYTWGVSCMEDCVMHSSQGAGPGVTPPEGRSKGCSEPPARCTVRARGARVHSLQVQ